MPTGSGTKEETVPTSSGAEITPLAKATLEQTEAELALVMTMAWSAEAEWTPIVVVASSVEAEPRSEMWSSAEAECASIMVVAWSAEAEWTPIVAVWSSAEAEWTRNLTRIVAVASRRRPRLDLK